MKDLEAELMNSYSLMDSGGNIELFRGEDGSVTMRPNPMPYLRSPMRQAEPQSSLERTVEELPAAVGGLAGGATAATVGLPGDIAGLAAGAYKALFPDEGEGRLEAFTNTLSDISDKYGSGAVKGYLRDQAEQVGASDAQMKVLEEAMALGEFGGVGGLAKGLVTKGPQILSKAGDFIEGAGEGAKARMGGATLTSGVNPDPLIAAAGDAVAKFRAPTEKQPGAIAFHGSGADFDEFKLEKIGTGEGAQAYGYGLYFAEKEDIASYYKNMMQRSVDIDGKPYIRGNNINDDLVDPDIADDLGATNGDLEAAIKDSEEFLQEMIADDNVNAIRSTSRELEKLKELRGRITSNDQEGKMYKVGLEPKPEDMLDYQLPIEQQPENIQQTVKKALSYIYPDVKDPALSMRGSDLQNAIINRIAVSRGNIEKMSDPIDADIARIDPNNKKTEAAIAAQIMLEQGIPGMKYRDAGSRGGAKSLKDASFNYVIFDDKMIKILEKYGIVGPVAITGVAASQQEGESDGRSA